MTLVVCVLALSGCASTTYRPFETRGDGIFDGKGGVKKSAADGTEIWDFGDPPRRYKVLGFIDDERPGGVASMSRLYDDVAKKAREVGGQALIQVRNQSQIVGYQATDSATATANGTPSTATGSAATTPVRKNKAQFIVIRYVD